MSPKQRRDQRREYGGETDDKGKPVDEEDDGCCSVKGSNRGVLFARMRD